MLPFLVFMNVLFFFILQNTLAQVQYVTITVTTCSSDQKQAIEPTPAPRNQAIQGQIPVSDDTSIQTIYPFSDTSTNTSSNPNPDIITNTTTSSATTNTNADTTVSTTTLTITSCTNSESTLAKQPSSTTSQTQSSSSINQPSFSDSPITQINATISTSSVTQNESQSMTLLTATVFLPLATVSMAGKVAIGNDIMMIRFGWVVSVVVVVVMGGFV